MCADLDQPSIEKLLNAKQKAVGARDTAKAAAEALVEGSPVPQLGGEVWRQMLLRAREFAAEAFPELAPPQVATADVCVLCHQPLGEDLNKLRTFFNAADKRRKELEEEGKAYEDGPLVAEVLS